MTNLTLIDFPKHRMKINNTYLILVLLSFLGLQANAQIQYQNVTNKKVSLGSYGRVGVDWSFENGGSIGRRLNLNNMGSIGGRLEEQDYFELAPAFHFIPQNSDSTIVSVQIRFAMYSHGLTSIGNSTTTSIDGLTLAVPELFAEARNIKGKDLSVWIGSRLYRGPDVHIADHFYFNDHSGQGFGVEYKKTRFSTIFVASTDTSSTVPPYFYLNIKSGTPSAEMRQRVVFIGEHDFEIDENNTITALGEYHHMSDADSSIKIDSIEEVVNFPLDYGYVLGLRHTVKIKKLLPGSFNDFTVRYGGGIANGGDGGVSRTYLTFGAPDTTTLSFKGAYSLAIVNHMVLNISKKYSLNGYIIFTTSKGGADSNHMSKTYFGKEVFNRKLDFTMGVRNEHYISDYFHLLTELHYSQRKDGENPIASMFKVSVAPVYVPTGGRNLWVRPHLRFIASLSRYNDFAMDSQYSPYLEFVGSKRWGYYFGVKAEWWVWN